MQEAIPSDLHLLLWTPAAAPLSAALASPGVYGGISPLWPSAGSADRATGSASRGESNEPKLEEMHPSFLDTPNLLQLPLPGTILVPCTRSIKYCEPPVCRVSGISIA